MAGKELKVFKPFETELAEYKERYVGAVYDMEDKKQEKQARSDRFAISKVIGRLDAAHKDLKAPLLEQVKIVDGKRKEIKDQLLDIQSGIKDQIAAVEAKRQKRVDDIRARINAMAALAEPPEAWTAWEVYDAMKNIEAIKIDDSFEEFREEALNTKVNTCIHLQNTYDALVVHEREAESRRALEEEMRQKAQAEREADIKKQAELDAKARAEESIAAEKRRADEERQRADEAVRVAEDRAKKEADMREQLRLAKIADEAAEKKRREEDEQHRKTVTDAAITALAESASMNVGQAAEVVAVIIEGRVPNIKIVF